MSYISWAQNTKCAADEVGRRMEEARMNVPDDSMHDVRFEMGRIGGRICLSVHPKVGFESVIYKM
jgi:hypothetical protein